MVQRTGDGPVVRLRSFSTVHLFMMLPWIGIVVAARVPIRDNSFLWHITAGRIQSATGEVLTVDPFSYTFAGAPWRTQAWLGDLLYSWLHGLVGLDFVPWLIAVVALATVTFMGAASLRASGSLVATALILVIVAWVGVAFLSPRPVLFSYALLGALGVILQRERLRWSLPLLIWVWAALHGSFVLGLGLMVLHGLAGRRRIGREVGVSLLLASLTAHGLGVWQTLGRFLSNRAALDLISEWAPPRLTNPDLAPYILVIGLIIWGAATDSISRRDLIVVIPFLVFGLTAVRSLFPAVIVLSPYVARAIGSRLDRHIGGGGVHWAVKGLVAGLIIVMPFLVTPTWEGLSESRFPIAEATALNDTAIFHDDVVGGYLIYARPDLRVYVDDRAELYGAEHFRDLLDTRNGRLEWQDVFERNNIQQALLSANDGLVQILELSGWEYLTDSESYVLLVRPGS